MPFAAGRGPDGILSPHDTNPSSLAQEPLRGDVSGDCARRQPRRSQQRQPDLPRDRLQDPRHARCRDHARSIRSRQARRGPDQRTVRRLRHPAGQCLSRDLRRQARAADQGDREAEDPGRRPRCRPAGASSPTRPARSERSTTPSRRSSAAVLDRSPTIGVRGEYTQDFVKRLGFRDIEVIGCPSMFLRGDQLSVTKRVAEPRPRIADRVQPDPPGSSAMGPLVDLAHRALSEPATTSPQEIEALKLLLWGEDVYEHRRPDSPMPIHPRPPADPRRQDPVLRRSVAVDRLHARVRLQSSGPASTATSPPCSPGPRAYVLRARHADARAGALLRDPAP